MASYIPQSRSERQKMLEKTGASSIGELFADISEADALSAANTLPPDGVSESEAFDFMEALSLRNTRFRQIFRGAGAYDRYIPAIVRSVTAKEEFLTAYTPYQAEISQGVLQSIFEYQTMICRLTGMDVANASMYNGAQATAEAAAMCRGRDKSRVTVLLSDGLNPATAETVRTYCFGNGMNAVTVPLKNGKTDDSALASLVGTDTACLCIQQPNYFGIIEDAEALGTAAHAAGAKFIMNVEPIAASVLKTPGECGADIAVGEGQPLGMPLSFGGPYLGFMAVTQKLTRSMPGRVVGETRDANGNRAFVLTLQAREQHIRREKAGSNICSNEALCALTAAVYMAAMGDDGMRDAAMLGYNAAHRLASLLEAEGYKAKYPDSRFFNEFVTVSKGDTDGLLAYLLDKGILGGLPLENGDILWCCTEKNNAASLDGLVSAIREFNAKGAKHDELDI